MKAGNTKRKWNAQAKRNTEEKRKAKKKWDAGAVSAQLQLYDRIFCLADKNMKENGMEFPYSLPAFHSIIGVPPDIVHAGEFEGISGDDFIVAAYVRCFGRLPDEAAWKVSGRLKRRFAGREEYIHYALLSSISSSAEFACCKRRMKGLKEPGQVRGRPFQLIRRITERVKVLAFRYIVIPVWKLMPNGIRNIVRVCTGREKKP